MELKIRINKNSILSLCIAAYYAIAVLSRVQRTLFLYSSAFQRALSIVTYLVIIVTLLRLIQKFSNIRILIILELVIAALFLISRFMGNLGELDWVNTYTQIAIIYIPLAVAAYNIVDREKLLHFLYIISLIATPVLILTTLFSYGGWDSSYDMAMGYIMMFTALIILADFIVHVRVINIVLAVILSLFILFAGSRGPFICIFAFIIIELLLSKQINIARKVVILAVLAVLAVIVVLNFNSIISLVYQASQRLGFNSRSLRLLMQGEALSHDSGRLEIWAYYVSLINKKPILGYGIMGGRFFNNWYPHNFVLELILSFGYPGGIILIIAVVFIMFMGIRSNDKYNSVLAVLFVSYCTLLLVSNTFLDVWQFFVCMALCIPQGIKVRLRRRGAVLE